MNSENNVKSLVDEWGQEIVDLAKSYHNQKPAVTPIDFNDLSRQCQDNLCIITKSDIKKDRYKNKVSYPLVTFERFQTIILDMLVESNKELSPRQIFENSLKYGMSALNKDNFKVFLKSLIDFDVYCLDSMFVDVGDNDYYWLVCGLDAILVKKPLF